MNKGKNPGLQFWLLTGIFLFALYFFRQALYPFLIAFALGYLLDPALDRLEERNVPRTAGIFILLAVVLALLVGCAAYIYPILEKQVLIAIDEMPRYAEMAKEKLSPLIDKLSSYDREKANEIIQSVMEKVGALPLEILKAVYRFIISTFSSVAGIVSALFGLVVIPVAAFYFLRDIDRIMERSATYVPLQYREETMEVFKEINRTLSAFVRGQLTVALVMAFFYSLGLYLLGTPMGLFIGLLAGFSNVVPYLPLVTGLLPALILTYLHFGFEWHLAGVLGVFAAVQLLEGFYLTPKIMGKSVGLHPLMIMFALLAGGLAFGPVGLILAVPAAAVLKVIWAHGEKKYRASEFYKGYPDEGGAEENSSSSGELPPKTGE